MGFVFFLTDYISTVGTEYDAQPLTPSAASMGLRMDKGTRNDMLSNQLTQLHQTHTGNELGQAAIA